MPNTQGLEIHGEKSDHEEEWLWRREQLLRHLQISAATMHRYLNAGILPAPIRIGRSCRWVAQDVRAAISKFAPVSR